MNGHSDISLGTVYIPDGKPAPFVLTQAAVGRDAATARWFEELRSDAATRAAAGPSAVKAAGAKEVEIVADTNDAIIADHQRVIAVRVDAMAAIIEKDEMIVPNKKIVKGGSSSGSAGQTVIIENYIERVDATDQASFDAQLIRSRRTINDINFAGLKSNSKSRRFDQ